MTWPWPIFPEIGFSATGRQDDVLGELSEQADELRHPKPVDWLGLLGLNTDALRQNHGR